MKTPVTRRRFLQKMAMLAGGSALLNDYDKLGLMRNALAAPTNYDQITDYKSLVCIYLAGGNDSFNMFVPNETQTYADYADLRTGSGGTGNMAIPQNELLGVTADGLANGPAYGFNPVMSKSHALYTNSQLAIVSNVGNLIEPLSKQDYFDILSNGSGKQLPDSLGSHSHQTRFWQTGAGGGAATPYGWGGGMADILAPTNVGPEDSDPTLPNAFSLGSSNAWLNAISTAPLSLSASGIDNFIHLAGTNSNKLSLYTAWNEVLNINNPDPHALKEQYNLIAERTKQRIIDTKQALTFSDGTITTPYNSNDPLSSRLRMVARMIYARGSLGMKRQIFFVPAVDNYDSHNGGRAQHEGNLSRLDNAIYEFQIALESFGAENSVTTFTGSEFGRTLGSNGNGTDHGWGSHHMVIGGAVQGGKTYGTLPILASDSPDNLGNSLLPSTAMDQYGATLAKWMGINDTDLPAIFQNLNNFSVKDLGFLTP